MRKTLFLTAFCLLVLVGIVHFVASRLYLYWVFHYFDSLVHFLGGLTVGFASVWWVMGDGRQLNRRRLFQTVILGALLVGIVWELFELAGGITMISDGMLYVTDTVSDIVMDVLGGVVAGIYIWKKFLDAYHESK